ncbi:hypothetical protein EFP6CTSP_18640 [Enterococcus faecium]|nr:hypothetical protein EFP6CTSP_18640 [Enterococcus faecium]
MNVKKNNRTIRVFPIIRQFVIRLYQFPDSFFSTKVVSLYSSSLKIFASFRSSLIFFVWLGLLPQMQAFEHRLLRGCEKAALHQVIRTAKQK